MKLRTRREIPNGVDRFCSVDGARVGRATPSQRRELTRNRIQRGRVLQTKSAERDHLQCGQGPAVQRAKVPQSSLAEGNEISEN